MTTLLFSFAVGIILLLSAVALYYQIKLSNHNKKRAALIAEQESARAKKFAQTKNDLAFLARSFIDDQIELNEVSLRIHHLLNILCLEGSQRSAFEVFDSVADQIKTVPTHANWKALDKKSRKAFEKLFKDLESRHKKDALHAAERLARGELNKLVH